jgi:hypothetical protein
MLRPHTRSSFVALALLSLAAACEPSKPPETPDKPASSADPDKGPAADPAPSAEPKADPPADTGAQQPPPEPGKSVPAGMALDTYEMTPSDCDALGRHYGDVARKDQAAALSPKLNEKQRAATMEQIEKVVGKLEERWTTGCHTSLVNGAVDHGAIKCALASKSVKEFDTCLNGPGGTPQPVNKSGGKKKK